MKVGIGPESPASINAPSASARVLEGWAKLIISPAAEGSNVVPLRTGATGHAESTTA